MILISVKSEVVDDKRQFKSDAAALRFLKRIDRLHMSHRNRIAGKRPRKTRFNTTAYDTWLFTIQTCINLRIEIINTKYNQLNLPL